METKKRIRNYIIVSLCWTYFFWVSAAIISNINSENNFIFIFHLLGGIGPVIATLLYLIRNKCWKEYLIRLINFKGFSPLVISIILLPILFSILSPLIIKSRIEIDKEFLANGGIIYGIGLLFFGPLPEELGWRGVLFHESNKLSTAKAQTITVIVWIVFHLPLFFIVGSYQYNVGFFTKAFAIWCADLITQSVVMGYLYLFSRKSIASAILFHYIVNLMGELIAKDIYTQTLCSCLYLLLAVFCIFAYNKNLFSKK